jgi:hypothetical protein
VRNSSLIKRSCAENVTGLKHITEDMGFACDRFHNSLKEDIFIATRQGWRQNLQFKHKKFMECVAGGAVEERWYRAEARPEGLVERYQVRMLE